MLRLGQEGRQTAGPPGGEVWEVIYHPTDPRIAYASAGRAGFYRSTDAGESWEPINEGLTITTTLRDVVTTTITSVIGHPLAPTLLFASSGGSVYRSSDGGEHWTTITEKTPPYSYVNNIAFDASDAAVVYLQGSKGRFYRTTDGGETWEDLSDGMPTLWPFRDLPKIFLAAHPSQSGWVYTGGSLVYSDGREVYKQFLLTTDGGNTWINLTENLPPGAGQLRDVILSRSHPDRVWLLSDRVYVSEDGG